LKPAEAFREENLESLGEISFEERDSFIGVSISAITFVLHF
jgi:hypothetical protein